MQLAQPYNVSQAYDFPVNYGLLPHPYAPIPGFGQNANKRRKLGSDIPYHKARGLTNPTNEAGVITVFSRLNGADDWFNIVNGTPGIPLFSNTELPSLVDSDVRADLTTINFWLEEYEIKKKTCQADIAKNRIYNGNNYVPTDFEVGNKLKINHAYSSLLKAPANHSMYITAPGSEGRSQSMIANLRGELKPYSTVEQTFIKHYGTETYDFHNKWKFNGISQNAMGHQGSRETNEAYEILHKEGRASVLGVNGCVEARNIFTLNPRIHDRLYFIMVPIQMNGLSLIRPSGESSGFGLAGTCFQLRAVSTSDGFDALNFAPGRYSFNEKQGMAKDAGIGMGISGSRPERYSEMNISEYDYDTYYMLKNKVLRREGFILDDDENGAIMKRVTDDLEDLPPATMDLYAMYTPQAIGSIAHLPGTTLESEQLRLEAHRNLNKFKNLPLMSVFTGNVIGFGDCRI